MNEFESRPLAAQSEEPVQSPPVFTPPSRRRRSRNKLQSLIAWGKQRGPKKLIRDGAIAVVGLGILYVLFLWFTLPDISDPRSLIASQSSVITDRNGTELYRLYNEENRTFIEGSTIPEHMKQAIVSIEDQRFYDRGCLDIRALLRVVVRFGQAGGASTLTRQLARNALDLKGQNIVNRKFRELILGCQLESNYSKDELLELYLNWIPFGQNAYGIEQASQTYFGVSASELTVPQSAILAALPQLPTYYSPYGRHVRTTVDEATYEDIVSGRITKASQVDEDNVYIGLLGDYVGTGSSVIYIGGRTDQVLQNMKDLGHITEAEKLEALTTLETIEFKPSREDIRAPHFVLWVKAQVEELLADGAEEGLLNQGGITIQTTLDWELQQAAENIVAARRDDIGSIYESHNIALVSVETGTNEIRAYVGNADYNDDEHDGKVDMARAPRQPGSSFKPFVYGAAFENGYGPATVLYDVPTKIGEDAPQNFDGGFWGLTNIRKALAGSRNIPAIKAYFLAGEEQNVLNFASRIGAVSAAEQKRELQQTNPDFEYGWPLALGAGETPLLEMTQAYATIANGGVYKPLISIKRITDKRGNILYETEGAEEGSQVIDPQVAYELTSVLSDVGARPNEFWQSVLSVPGFQAAAKTGTSNKCLKRDDNGNCTDRKPDNMWTMGYTPNLVTGVWSGNADATPLSTKAESLNLVSPIWKDFMVRSHRLLESPKANFDVPSGIVQTQISALSGQLPTECTPVAYRTSDIFRSSNAPTEADPACVTLMVDKVTGLLASDECPAEAAEERSFFAPQVQLASRFPQWQQSVIEWATDAMSSYDTLTGTFGSGTVLPLPLVPTEECSIALTPGRATKPSLTILSPSNGGGAPYPSFQPQLSIKVGSTIRELSATIDGKDAGSVRGSDELLVRAPRSVSEGGTHVLEVTLIDEFYNTVTDSVSFRFEEDNERPDVRITEPRGDLNARSGETITIEAEATDNGGIKYVQFYLDTRLLSTKPSSPYRLEWEQTLKEGTYEIRAVATDLAGNEDEDSIELTIE